MKIIIIIIITINYLAFDSVSSSQLPYMTNILENKLYLDRYKRMFLRTFLKSLIDLQSMIDPGRAFHHLREVILKA